MADLNVPNSYPSIQAMVDDWSSWYEPYFYEATGIPLSDFNKLRSGTNSLAEYQALFDQYRNQIVPLRQYTPEAVISIRNRVRDPAMKARDGFDWWDTVFFAVRDLARDHESGISRRPAFGIFNGRYYTPNTQLMPSYNDFQLTDPLAMNWPEGFQVYAAMLGEGLPEPTKPYKVFWAISRFKSDSSDNFTQRQPRIPFFDQDPSYPVASAPLSLVKYGSNGVAFQIYDFSTNEFRDYHEFRQSPDLAPMAVIPVSSVDADGEGNVLLTPDEVKQAIVESGLFKERTEYLIIGDEPRGGRGVFDMKTMMTPDDYSSLKQYLTFMPRQMLREFFMKKIWPSIPWNMLMDSQTMPSDAPEVTDDLYGGTRGKKQFEDLVWAAIIEVFNTANLIYINQKQITPWDWEQKKTDAYYVSQSKDAIEDLSKEIDEFRDVSLALDPKAKAIMEEYLTLPKLGEVGFEINRQNAVKELLKMKDYASAQAIIDAFRYASGSVIGEQLAKPVPYDVKSEDGDTMVYKS